MRDFLHALGLGLILAGALFGGCCCDATPGEEPSPAATVSLALLAIGGALALVTHNPATHGLGRGR